MNPPTEQKLALHTLEARAHDCSFAFLFGKQLPAYLMISGLTFAGCVFIWWVTPPDASAFTSHLCCWLTGFGCGAILRDARWLRAIRAKWPFQKKVTAWEKVQILADGGSIGDQIDGRS
jgi:hypothetical protein